MSQRALIATIERAWRSRWLSAAFLLLYGAVVGRGLLLGAGDRYDVDAQVRVRVNFAHTRTRDISLGGRATLFTARHDGQRALLVGPAELAVHCGDAASAMLHLQLEWGGARSGASFRLVDSASGATHVVDNLVVHHSGVVVPLPRAETTLRIVPSEPSLALRIRGLDLVTGVELTPFAVDVQWEIVHEDDSARVACGAGFWPRPASTAPVGPGAHLQTQRWAYLRIDPAKPGPHALRLVFTRPDPDAQLPILSLGGKRIWNPGEANMVWSRASTEDGVTTVELTADLGDSNVLGIECPGRVLSPFERGMNTDVRRLAYDFVLDRCEVRPAR